MSDWRGLKLGGIEDLLPFVNFLGEKGIAYAIDHVRMECIMVSFVVAGAKIELDFFEDSVEYAAFHGVEVDAAKAFRLMDAQDA